MDINFFNKNRILDGGMGQELLARGLKPKGTLWSASALLNKDYHKLLFDTHLDYIKAGAEVIVTTTFAARKTRLIENEIENKFEYINKKAGEIAEKTKKYYPNILVAGGLPPQNLTYEVDRRSENKIKDDFFNQANLLNQFVDFFYLDVLSSIREIKLAVESIRDFNKPFLIGAHISEGIKLPSGESISNILSDFDNRGLLGLILSCISPENFQANLSEIKKLGVPFGFKLNAFIKTNPIQKLDVNNKNQKIVNPNQYLGIRKDLTPSKMAEFAKKFKDAGATILGGCCETSPEHIKAFTKLLD